MRHSRTLRRLLGVIVAICGLPDTLAQCTPYWSAVPMDETPAMNGGQTIRTFFENDDAVIYFGTRQPARQLVRWDGSQITPVPRSGGLGSIPTTVFDIELIPYPAEPTVYATLRADGGAAAVARLNRATMQLELFGPIFDGFESAFHIAGFDSGGGVELYLTNWNNIRRWDGIAWQSVGFFGAVPCAPTRLCVWDDGSGSALYCVGPMRQIAAPGIPAVTVNGVARFDGQEWSAVGGGLTATTDTWCNTSVAFTAVVFDDGGGEALYVGGLFDQAGGVPAVNVARWDGQSWSAVGTPTGFDPLREVSRLRVLNDGTGEKLYACGTFRGIGGVPANGLAVWDGVSWSVPPGGEQIPYVYAEVIDVAFFDDGNGMSMYVNGLFTDIGAVHTRRFARYGCRCPDLTGDGFVGLDDLALVLASFGGPATGLDPDRDGDVDLHDLSVLLSYFGMTCP